MLPIVGSEKGYFNIWLSDAFRVSHTWLLGHHFLLGVWNLFFIDGGARTTPILENLQGVEVIYSFCF